MEVFLAYFNNFGSQNFLVISSFLLLRKNDAFYGKPLLFQGENRENILKFKMLLVYCHKAMAALLLLVDWY